MEKTLPNTQLDDPSKDGLRQALSRSREALATAAEAIDPDSFFKRSADDQWSAAEHTSHIVKSVNAVAKGLTFNKWLVRLRYGKASSSPLL